MKKIICLILSLCWAMAFAQVGPREAQRIAAEKAAAQAAAEREAREAAAAQAAAERAAAEREAMKAAAEREAAGERKEMPTVLPQWLPLVVSDDEATEAFAQESPQEVSLIVSADGATKTEAINNALRSAIEQTYGTFVSANTEILKDQLVKDEIATVSSGNIQKYSEVASVALPNGNTSVTLNVTVSLSKLVNYAQSKGSECEFAGATFGANLRLYQFNKKNEQIAIQNLIKQLDALRPIYDYEIILGDPYIVPNSNDELAGFMVFIRVKSNDKTKQFISIISNTLKSLAMTEDQVKPLKAAGFQVAEFCNYRILNQGSCRDCSKIDVKDTYYLYNKIPVEFGDFLYNILFDFAITDNNGKEYIILEGWRGDNQFIRGPHINLDIWGDKFRFSDGANAGEKFLSYIFIKNDPYYAQYYPRVMDLYYYCVLPTEMIESISRLNIRSTQNESSVFIIRWLPGNQKLPDCFRPLGRQIYAQIPIDIINVLKRIRQENPHPYESLDIRELSK